jgi:beta-aspartyl-peptidase (threonine type)
VAAVQNVPNPISLARAIMEKSDIVLLTGLGATRFAKEHKIRTCGQDDLITGREIARWRASQASPAGSSGRRKVGHSPGDTVGAVALDARGRIASGASTGGTPNKLPGRVGDCSMIGCGAYADDAVGGVSSSGWGEGIIRVVMAKSVIDMMRSTGVDPEKAAQDALAFLKKRTGGHGGIIAMNTAGAVGIAFNTPKMSRAYVTSTMKGPIAAV